MITFLFSCTIFNNIFISALKKANVVVTATADHNIKSGGSDIRIVRILLDGEEISFDSIQKDGRLVACGWGMDGGKPGQTLYSHIFCEWM